MGLRCHVCDGPVVNGRCKYCGMPYRNDEVLYHLNESRTDHYRHATPNARKIMKNQEIPVGDKKESLGRTSSREEIKAHQQKVRQDAVKRMTETKARPMGGQSENKTASGKRTEKKKKNKASAFSLAVSVIVVLFGLIPTIGEFVMEHVESWTVPERGTTEERAGFELAAASEFYEEEDAEGNQVYYLGTEFGEVIAGVDIEPGTYTASIERGIATVRIERPHSVVNYGIQGEDDLVVLVLQEGDVISVLQDETETDRIVLFRIDSH